MIEEKEFKVVNDIGLSIQTGIEQIERFFNSLSGVLINKPLIDSIKRFEALNCLLTKEQKEQISIYQNKYWSEKLANGLYLREEKKKRQEKLKVNLQLAFYNLSKGLEENKPKLHPCNHAVGFCSGKCEVEKIYKTSEVK